MVFMKTFDPNPYGYNYPNYYGYPYQMPEQYCINMAFLIYTGKAKFDPINLRNTRFVEIPPPTYTYSYRIGIFWTMVIPISMQLLAVLVLQNIFDEKENEIHTYMIIIGMDRYLYYLFYFIFSFLVMWIIFIPAGLATVIFIPVSCYTFPNISIKIKLRVVGGYIST